MSDEVAVVTAPTPTPVAAEPPTPAAEPAAPQAAPEDVAGLPEWTQKMIKDLRSEAATNRTKATTAEQTKQETMDAIAKALGLKESDDPAAAAKTAAAERDAARKQAQDATTTLAVYRMANKYGANPEALTDSRSFMRELEAIDPADAEFAAKVEAAITAAIEANPLLKTSPAAPPTRSGAPVGGGAAPVAEYSAEWVHQMAAEGHHDLIVKAKAEGKLNRLLAGEAS